MFHRFKYTGRLLPGAACLFLALGLAGCGQQTDVGDCLCNQQFRTITLTVVNEQGTIEPGVACYTLNMGSRDTVQRSVTDSRGIAVVADDLDRDSIRSLSAAMQVVGTKDTRRFEASFQIGTDQCRCHVYKFAGPDTVVLR